MSLILPNLYLGDIEVAEKLDSLKAINCTHILCATCTIGEKFPEDFKYLVIKVQDYEYENLLLQFELGLNFIKEGLASGGTVFVHCNAGVSRSASFIIAYLMREMDYELQAALNFVKSKRPQVMPNKGFLKQLKQYEYDLVKIRKQKAKKSSYRCFDFQMCSSQEEEKKESSSSKADSQAQDEIMKLLTQPIAPILSSEAQAFEAQQLLSAQQASLVGAEQPQPIEKAYSCKKCRKVLFDQKGVEEHLSEVKKHNVRKGERYEMRKLLDYEDCSSIFINQFEWIQVDEEQMKGSIVCPKCQSKLGTYTLYGGQCSCGKWNSPAFQIHKSKVDELNKITKQFSLRFSREKVDYIYGKLIPQIKLKMNNQSSIGESLSNISPHLESNSSILDLCKDFDLDDSEVKAGKQRKEFYLSDEENYNKTLYALNYFVSYRLHKELSNQVYDEEKFSRYFKLLYPRLLNLERRLNSKTSSTDPTKQKLSHSVAFKHLAKVYNPGLDQQQQSSQEYLSDSKVNFQVDFHESSLSNKSKVQQVSTLPSQVSNYSFATLHPQNRSQLSQNSREVMKKEEITLQQFHHTDGEDGESQNLRRLVNQTPTNVHSSQS